MTVYACLKVGRAVLDGQEDETIGHVAKAFATGVGLATDVVPLWFLPHLALSSLFVVVLLRCAGSSDVRRLAAIALGLFAIGVFAIRNMPRQFEGWPWSADLLPVSAALILAGFLCRPRIVGFVPDRRLLAAAASTFVLLHVGFDESMDLYDRMYGEVWVTTAQAMAGIYLCLCLSAYVTRHRLLAAVLAYVGVRTLFVLMFHISIELRLFQVLVARGAPDLLAGAVSFAAAICVPLLLYEVVVRLSWPSALLLPVASGRGSLPAPARPSA
jgi:fucose 4-O-acetylase-like acetyltransferase